MEGTLKDEGTYSHSFLSFVWITVSVLMVVEIVAIFVYYIKYRKRDIEIYVSYKVIYICLYIETICQSWKVV